MIIISIYGREKKTFRRVETRTWPLMEDEPPLDTLLKIIKENRLRRKQFWIAFEDLDWEILRRVYQKIYSVNVDANIAVFVHDHIVPSLLRLHKGNPDLMLTLGGFPKKGVFVVNEKSDYYHAIVCDPEYSKE